MHVLGQLHLSGDTPLSIEHGGLKIAATDLVAHRNIALQVLAIDECRALGSLYVRNLSQGNLSAGRNRDPDIADPVEALPILRQPSHYQIEAAITFEYLG